MTIFDFLVLKIENFGFENPYKHVLVDFGEFWKNRKKKRIDWEGGVGPFLYLLRILETNFFLEPVTFLKMRIFKKNFFRPQFGW